MVQYMSHDANQVCRCVGKHIPKYMELHRHHIWPLSEGGSENDSNLLWLCPTQHVNVHELWRIYDKYEGRPPWEILKGYSEYAREIVERGRELRRRAQTQSISQTTDFDI